MNRLGSTLFLALAVAASIPGPMVAQGGSATPTGQTLFVLDVAGTPVGEFPTSVKQLQGIMEVVIKDGQPMLKASARSEFLITLPRVLPPAFTLEFDLVPKAGGGNPQDLSFEATPAINQGGASAHVLWDSDGSLQIIGGGITYDAPMPEEFRTTLPGVLTNVVVTVEGPTIKLYTNGRRLYTLDRQFARGRVLRVFLGGQDDGVYAVHLAGLRISAGAALPTQTATNTSALSGSTLASAPAGTLTAVGGSTPPPGTPVGTPVATPAGAPTGPGVSAGPIPARTPAPAAIPTTTSQSQAATGGVPTTVANVSVVQGTAGPVVSWQPVSAPAAYSVRRWKINDLTCCNSASPAGTPLTGPPWQDAPLPVSGTYVYEVTATMAGGTASGQAQFVHFGSGGSIATVPAGTVPVPPMVNPPAGPAASGMPRTGTLPSGSPMTLGPATLTSTPRSGWGVTLQWPEVVNALIYRIERGATNQSFVLIGTIVVAQQPSQAGLHTFDDATILPGSSSLYRVSAEFLGGGVAASPLTRYDAPTHVGQVTNLTVSIAGPCDITSLAFQCTPYVATPTSKQYWQLTWNWTPVPGAVTHYVSEEKLIDPAAGFFLSTGGWNAVGGSSYWQTYSAPVKQARLCVSLIRTSSVNPVPNGTCLVTDIP